MEETRLYIDDISPHDFLIKELFGIRQIRAVLLRRPLSIGLLREPGQRYRLVAKKRNPSTITKSAAALSMLR